MRQTSADRSFSQRLCRPVLVILASLGLIAMGGATSPASSAIFGADSRTKLPKRLDHLRQSIGVIYNERTRTVCSAFCAGPDVIGTASHCVYRTKGEMPPPADKFVFVRPGTRAKPVRFAGAQNGAAAQHIVAGAFGISTKPPIEAARDWAFIKLQSPACRGHTLPIEPMMPQDIEREADAGRLFQAAFHRDYGRWTMAYSEPCSAGRDNEGTSARITERDFADPSRLLLHLCDTGGASSGSPLLLETPTGPKVVAINVGTFVQSRVLLQGGEVIKRMPAAPVANTAVASIAFADEPEKLRTSQIITHPADMKALQQRLTELGHYAGPVNGRFDGSLRQAIRAFEESAGLRPISLPTRALLEAVGRAGPR